MPKFKNTGGPVSVYAPAGSDRSLIVEHGEVCDAPGQLVDDADDRYLVEHRGVTRSWAKSRWEHVTDKPKPKPERADPAPVEG